MVSARTPKDPTPPTRPEGRIRPLDNEIDAAFESLRKGGATQAHEHLEFIDVQFGVEGAWRLLLLGEIAEAGSDFQAACRFYNLAFSRAFVAATGREGTFDSKSLRVAAIALTCCGRLYRRQDRPEDAERTHLAAYHLAVLHGSNEELWEIRVELGLDAALMGRLDESEHRFRSALESAEHCVEHRLHKRAVAGSNLSHVVAVAGRLDEAVVLARAARDDYRAHDISGPAAVRADVNLGSLLLRQGQSHIEARATSDAMNSIAEAVRLLAEAREAFLAFGTPVREEAALCGEQLDFAHRLKASVEE